MDYKNSKKWLNQQHFAMEDFDLKKIKKIVKLANLKIEKLKTIHLVGSNGKGSTAAFLANILQEEKYKTGLYTSPHLVEPTERMQINNKKISTQEFAKLTTYFKKLLKKNNLQANYFEIMTAIAIKYFLNQKIDFLVAEAGLGGRLDATNVLQGIISVITSISLEHTQFLGKTIEKIAYEKAGIIKKNSIVVISEKNKGFRTIFKNAKQKKCEMIFPKYKIKKSNKEEQIFDLIAPKKIENLKIKMIGKYQCENASLAITTAIALQKKGINISEKSMRKGLEKTFWRGRLQKIKENPLVLIDSAHNSAGWKTLENALSLFEYEKLFMVFGAMKDKQIISAKKILSKANQVFLTQSDSFRAEDPKKLQKILGLGEVCENEKIAITKALNSAGKKDLVLITGSIYIIGKAYKLVS